MVMIVIKFDMKQSLATFNDFTNKPLFDKPEDLALADEDDEDDEADKHVVGIGDAPEAREVRVHGADHFQDPVYAHHHE